MDQGTLVRDEIDAGAEFVRRFGRYAPVAAAFWLRAADKLGRYLYIASDQFTDRNTPAAYTEVARVIREMGDPNLDPFRVKVVRMDNPVVRSVMEIYQQYKGRPPARYEATSLGDVAVDDLYIYPQPVSTV
jgi:hypothetical protein